MKKYNLVVLFTASLLSFSALADRVPVPGNVPNNNGPYIETNTPAAHTRVTNPSAVVVEALGRALVWSVGFDQVVSDQIAVGIAIGTAGTERGAVAGERATLIPIYMNYYFTKTANSFFVTAGADIVGNSSKVKGNDANMSNVRMPSDAILGTGGVGFESRLDSGFLFRVAGYGILAQNFSPWVGFSFGMSF